MAEAPTSAEGAPADVPTPAAPNAEAAPDLGDAGKKALDEERKARKSAEKAARDLTAQLEKLALDTMSEQERLIAQARAEGRKDALTEANSRLLRAEIKGAAAGKLADPDDAIHLLDLSSIEIADDGSFDSSAIAAAIDALVTAKPYLSPTPGIGSGEGGPRGAGAPLPLNGDPLLRTLEQKLGLRPAR